MSIYHVPIKSWFVSKRSPFHQDLHIVEAFITGGAKCHRCGEPITLAKGYCSHAIGYGFTEMFCSKACLNGKTPKQSVVLQKKRKKRSKVDKKTESNPC